MGDIELRTTMGDIEFRMVAIKRSWVPEWLYRMFNWVIPYQPFRWIFTRPVNGQPR